MVRALTENIKSTKLTQLFNADIWLILKDDECKSIFWLSRTIYNEYLYKIMTDFSLGVLFGNVSFFARILVIVFNQHAVYSSGVLW